MAKARKEYRELTVSEATNYGRKTASMLRIQRLWFHELGFNIGDPVLVKCKDGKLVIMRDTTRAEQKEGSGKGFHGIRDKEDEWAEIEIRAKAKITGRSHKKY